MKKVILTAAIVGLALATSAQSGWAARKSHSQCATQTSAEAEKAIRYMTELMVASSACKNTVYAEFALRNRPAIIGYQKAMITHMHGTSAFDKWDTVLANEYSQRQAALPAAQFCQQAAPLMQQASALDAKGFKAYAAAQVAVATTPVAKCGK
jgi:hypothetical protein